MIARKELRNTVEIKLNPKLSEFDQKKFASYCKKLQRRSAIRYKYFIILLAQRNIREMPEIERNHTFVDALKLAFAIPIDEAEEEVDFYYREKTLTEPSRPSTLTLIARPRK